MGLQEVRAVGRCENGHLRIGVGHSGASEFLFNVLHSFGDRFGKVCLDLVEGTQDDHIASIERYELDVAFALRQHLWCDFEVEELWEERVWVIFPKNHPLSSLYQIRWTDLRAERVLLSSVLAYCEMHDHFRRRAIELGLQPNVRFCEVNQHSLLSLVAAGQGVSLVRDSARRLAVPGTVQRPLADEVLTFCAMWSRRNDNPALRRLLSMARSMSKGAPT
jgi:DNA-binding transcriptional LysR family regulator